MRNGLPIDRRWIALFVLENINCSSFIAKVLINHRVKIRETFSIFRIIKKRKDIYFTLPYIHACP